MEFPTTKEIERIREEQKVSLTQAIDIWQILNYDESDIEAKDLKVTETSNIADRFDSAKAIKLKVPKGRKGMTVPAICGFCGSIRKQEVKK